MTLPSRETLLDIYETTRTIAVVGASANPEKASNSVPRYLQGHGYRIIPVTPRDGEILGEPTRQSLGEIDAPVDVVQVFRPPEEGPDIARAAVELGARVLWMQPGTSSDEAEEIAGAAGLTVINGHCMRATHGLLGLGTGD